jgi:hypothetical protein
MRSGASILTRLQPQMLVDGLTCVICYESATEAGVVLSCAHEGCTGVFHKACIERALSFREGCPVCRRDVKDNCETVSNFVHTSARGEAVVSLMRKELIAVQQECAVLRSALQRLHDQQAHMFHLSYLLEQEMHASFASVNACITTDNDSAKASAAC